MIDRLLVRWDDHPEQTRALVCIPWAGAGAARFAGWSEAMPQDTAVWGVRFAGRENRLGETPLTTIDALVTEVVDAMRSLGDGPVALFGHCSGGLIAFEAAHELERRSVEVTHLLVASQVAPRRITPTSRPLDVAAELSRAGFDEASLLDEELMQMLQPAIEADMRAVAGYRPRETRLLDAPIVALTGSADRAISADHIDDWRLETAGTFTQLELPDADHLFTGEHWRALGEAIGDQLQDRHPRHG